MRTHYINSSVLTFDQLDKITRDDCRLELSPEAKEKIIRCRTYLDNKLKKSDAPIYGINTGFGSLCDVKIDSEDLEQLQKNLVMSHACGLGEEVPLEIVKLMLFLKIQSLSYGHSGVQLQTVQRLIDFYNHDILPVVFTQGSLGASGDLAPLAHLSLPLLGLGEVYYKGEKRKSSEVLNSLGWESIHLQSKEGLALLNGTQFMSAYGTWCILKARKLSKFADDSAALSIDAFDCRLDPFNELIHKVRPHKGQLKTAKYILDLLQGSEIASQTKVQVQDPYSFRCVPQVHGASKDAIEYVEQVFLTEINSVTDNPNIFPEEDLIISGGNFHGQPLAIALDFLCIALAELGSISERRTYQLISGQRGLPAFLVAKPGLNSGFMIPQYTAASIVSENKQLCTPASVDSIVSSNGQEDHVSMGANAATKSYRVLNNLTRILAIEWMNAAQALEFRKPFKTSLKQEAKLSLYREKVLFVENDRVLSTDINATVDFINGSL